MIKSSMKRLLRDQKYIQSKKFITLSRNDNPSSFTRIRKFPLPMVVLSILARKGLTLKMEIRNFIKQIQGKTISKVGYLKQRLKLNPEALKELNRFHIQNFYNEQELKKYKGYLIYAVDGSSINLPTNGETLDYFGNVCRKNIKKKAQAGISCLYDCLNRMILDITINKTKFDERTEAMKHLKIAKLITEEPSIVMMDRGYPGMRQILEMIEMNQKFVVRLDRSTYKQEQQSMKSDDEITEIKLDQKRTNFYRGTPLEEKMKKLGSVHLRFVRIELESQEIEYLLTNLNEEFCTKEIYALYGMRWGIETAYDELKNKLQLENFTGTKPILIQQDIYASVYLLNIMQDIILDAQQEADFLEKKYKHQMIINRNIAFGILKEETIRWVLLKSKRKKEQLFLKIIDEIKSNIVPVRANRKYDRTKSQLASRYSNTHKRSY